MDRVIKFSGKRVDNGEWVDGGYAKYDELVYITLPKVNMDNNVLWFIEVIPATVGQFTGLLDKNGKEIYKGHIVLCNRHINDAFDKTTFLICVDEYFRYQGVSKLGNEISVEEFAYAEIIGNIHDNPELINQ